MQAALGGHEHPDVSPGYDASASAMRVSLWPGPSASMRVGVGGVDEGDSGIERGVHGRDGAASVRPPLDGQRHAAESDGADGAVSDAFESSLSFQRRYERAGTSRERGREASAN